MSKIWTKFSGLVVFGLLLGACVAPEGQAGRPEGRAAALAAPVNPCLLDKSPVNTFVNMQQVFKPQGFAHIQANDALASAVDLRAVLQSYKAFGADEGPNANLRGLINSIRAAGSTGNSVPGLRGFGGTTALAFAEVAADQAVNSSAVGGGHAGKSVVVSMTGQITNYEYVRTGFDPITGEELGRGLLWVITTIQTSVNNIDQPGLRVQYCWKLEVEEDGFRVVRRDDSHPDGPFPRTMDLSPEAVDRIKCQNQPTGCNELQYKLWATGFAIAVKEIHFRRANAPWDLLDKLAQENRVFYVPSEDNCIDMMFVSAPPATLGGLQPPAYCLGRCANPPIVNTGW